MLTELHRKCCINKYTDYYIQYIDKDASEVLQSNTCPLLVQNFTQFDFYISPTFIVWKIYKETVCHFKSDDFFSLCALSPWSSERICKIVYLYSLSHKAYPHQTSNFAQDFMKIILMCIIFLISWKFIDKLTYLFHSEFRLTNWLTGREQSITPLW